MLHLDAKFIGPFIDGTIETLKVQCGVDIQAQKPYIKGRTTEEASIDIAGLITIHSNEFNGSIGIGFPQSTFLHIMEKMIGETHTEITKDLEDGAGELINIIFGSAKRVLNDQGYTLQKALPSVSVGMSLKMHKLSHKPCIVIPFKSNAGEMYIEIEMEAA